MRSRQAARDPRPTALPTNQNKTETPSTAPTLPKIRGMSTLDVLIAIRRRASAWLRCGSGVMWCKVLMIMGCTDPKAKPRNTEQIAMPQAPCMSG